MIDLSSKDCTYTKLKVMQIKSKLEDLKPEIKDLSPLDVINMSLIYFSYLCESDCIELDEDDLIITYANDEMCINLDSLKMELKFKNKLLNEFLSIVIKEGFEGMMKEFETVKELVGDEDGF